MIPLRMEHRSVAKGAVAKGAVMPTFPPDGRHLKGGRNAAPVLAKLAREFNAPIVPIVVELRRQGLSLRAIAGELEQRGIKPRHGAGWSAAQVLRILKRGSAAGWENTT